MNFGTLGTGFGGLGRGGGGAGYTFVNAEAAAVSAAMVPEPSNSEKADIDTLVGAMKTAGTWSLRDVIQIYAAHSQASGLLNWKNPGTFDATLVGTPTPTFTTNRDFTTDGSQNYVDTGFNPATAGGSFAQNSANLSIWSRTSAALTGSAVGWFDGTDGTTMLPRNGSGQFSARINQATANGGIASNNGSGYFSVNRSGAGAAQFSKNGADIGSGTEASTALNSETLKVGRIATATYTAFACAALLAGGALTLQQRADEYAAMLAYMQARGAS